MVRIERRDQLDGLKISTPTGPNVVLPLSLPTGASPVTLSIRLCLMLMSHPTRTFQTRRMADLSFRLDSHTALIVTDDGK